MLRRREGLRAPSVLAAAALWVPAVGHAQSNWSMSFHDDGGTWRPAVGLCELQNHNVIVFRGKQTLGAGAQPVGGNALPAYRSYEKANPSSGLRLDASEPEGCGAGTCYFPFDNGSTRYMYRRSNVSGNPLPDASVAVTSGGTTLLDQRCRNPANTRFVCFTNTQRNVYITKDPTTGKYAYTAYTAGNATPFVLQNGTRSEEGTGFYRYFFVNGSYRYELIYARVKLAEYTPYAEIVVTNGGAPVTRLQCRSYTFGAE